MNRYATDGAFRVALEQRLLSEARATKDVDLGQRSPENSLGISVLTDRLTEALAINVEDPFVYRFVDMTTLALAGLGDVARARVTCDLAGRPFGSLQVDIASRKHELSETERVRLPARLAFAAIPAPEIEAISLARHVAEKFHAMLRRFDDRENTRVRDLVDVVILHEHGLIEPGPAAAAVRRVFTERATAVPSALPPFPSGWPQRYDRIAREHGIGTATFAEANAVVTNLWSAMFPTQQEDS